MNLLQDQDAPAATEDKPADPAATPAETAPATDSAAPETTPPAGDASPAPGDAATPAPVDATPAEPITTTTTDAVEAAADATESGAGAVAEKVADAAEAAVNVDPRLIFVLGVAMMAMFLWYFGTESARRKRMIGSFLAIAVTAGSLWFYQQMDIKRGIEIQGGIAMTIRIIPSGEREITPESQQQAIKVLSGRLNETGLSDITLAPQGNDRIFLQVPGVGEEELEDLKKRLKQVAKLDFSIVHPNSRELASSVAIGSHVEPGFKAIPNAPEVGQEDWSQEQLGWELVKIPFDMSGTHVKSAQYFYGPKGDSISVGFDNKGAGIMGALTIENQGRQLAIILSDAGSESGEEDLRVLSAPNIEEPFSTGCQITGGGFDKESASALASALENPLENPIEIEYSNYITPTMGEETLRQGIAAGLAGLAVTLMFILLYYRFAGILAMVGLGINIAIIFGALALFKFTLTLPGIAGIILTIGVAIDANVLIYERLREEMAGGKTLPTAIKTAYEKALSAIVDANITTLFTAIILFIVATGTVKGFAVTLTIGILATLFSALIVTRVCFNWATETNFLKKLSFMNFIPSKTIDFLGPRKICAIVSAAVVCVSLIVIPSMDPRGVDLKGGDFVTIRSEAQGLSVETIQDSLQNAGLDKEPIVQSQTPVGATGEFFTIRTEFESAPKVLEQIEGDFGIDLADTTTDSVGSAVGAEMLNKSALALGLGILIILIYVTIRFEFAFALGAIVALFHDLIITLGVTTLLGREVSLITIGAFLTIAGYSINDTIVVFDRVREGLKIKRGNVKDVMNYCLNATLGRTLLTSVTTLITVLVLFIFGGPALRNFSLTLIIGVLIGTYSSIFIASPIVLWWAKKTGTNLRREVLDSEQGKVGEGGDQVVVPG